MMDLHLGMALNLLLAWGAGALVGFERSYNGRAAGFRTHALVGLASASAILVASAPAVTPGFSSALRLDPTHLAQGIMTGIGFLGAGVIFKEGVSVQGLTTAASIWATAAVGLLFGLGMPIEGCASLAGALFTLTAMRWVEGVYPWRVYAMAVVRFQKAEAPDEAALRLLLGADVRLDDVSYRLTDGGGVFEYQGNIEALRKDTLNDLSERLKVIPGLIEFQISRISK